MVSLSPAMTIEEAVNEYFLRYGYGGFPVMDNGKFLGIVTLKEIKNVPRDRWGGIPLADIAGPHDQRRELFPQDDIMRALQLMIQEDKGRIVVTKNGTVVGWITRNGIARYVQVIGR